MSDRHETRDEPRVVVTDKRRLDPETGRLRTGSPFPQGTDPADPAGAAQPLDITEIPPGSSELEAARQEAAERTADLQRVTAEYANYRKRVDRDRELVLAMARERVVAELLPVLDDIDRAQLHGDVTGAFRTVADKLGDTLNRLGLQRFAQPGDSFNPARHEAVQFATEPDAVEQTVQAVLRHGYTLGDKVIRVAVVAVVGPGDDPADGPVGDDSVAEGQAIAEADAAVNDALAAEPAGDPVPPAGHPWADGSS